MTFKRLHHEADLTEADFDFLLPLADPVTALHAVHPLIRERQFHHANATSAPACKNPSACAKTFDIVELAEAIFLYLPPETVLCKVQRVCRKWSDFVQTNELIQQYLFFKPIHVENRTHQEKACIAAGQLGSDNMQAEVNIEERWGNDHAHVGNPWLYLFHFSSANLLTQSPHSSWNRMLLSQPPRTHVYLDEVVYTGSEEQPFPTLGDLVPAGSLFGMRYRAGWKPLLGWDTLRQAKRCRRWDEYFVELEIADLERAESG